MQVFAGIFFLWSQVLGKLFKLGTHRFFILKSIKIGMNSKVASEWISTKTIILLDYSFSFSMSQIVNLALRAF